MKKIWPRVSPGSVFVSCLVLLLVLAGGCFVPSAHAGRNHIVVQTWGGSITEAQEKAFFEPFTEETGIKVVAVEAGVSVGGKLDAMMRSGNIEWDMISADYEGYNQKYYDKGYLEDIDYGIVTHTKDLVPGSLKKWGVAQYLECVVLAYNTKVFPEGKRPKSWKDFFDVKRFPGPRAMHNWGGPSDNLSIALMSEGVSPDDLFPLDFDRAFKIMDKIKPHIKVWYTSGEQLMQALIDGEVVMAVSTDGRAKTAKRLGAPVAIEWNQALYFLAYNCVVKNSPMKEAAMRLIDFCNRPEQQAVFTNYMGYSGTNKKAVRYIHPSMQKDLATYPANFGKLINLYGVKNGKWQLSHMDEIDERWNTWIAK
ncbi:MAG: ABC transporter substrate-binding protein [Deltaproteobacteria bacterium]|nr:ABC transporter substrate-binding protein [Deltaproteobacteria bacterium]